MKDSFNFTKGISYIIKENVFRKIISINYSNTKYI